MNLPLYVTARGAAIPKYYFDNNHAAFSGPP